MVMKTVNTHTRTYVIKEESGIICNTRVLLFSSSFFFFFFFFLLGAPRTLKKKKNSSGDFLLCEPRLEGLPINGTTKHTHIVGFVLSVFPPPLNVLGLFCFLFLFLVPFRGKWVLLDGDKIAALCAAFIHEELAKLGLDKVLTALTDVSCRCCHVFGRAWEFVQYVTSDTPEMADGGRGVVICMVLL